MGFIKGVIILVVSFLLFFTFIAMNISLTIGMSLSYDVIKPELNLLVNELTEKEIDMGNLISESLPEMQEYCVNFTEFVFSIEGYVFSIPCEIVNQGEDAVANKMLDEFIEKIYYQDYECSFWDCFGKTGKPFFLVSKQSRDYFYNKFYLCILISVILFLIIFLFSKTKNNSFIVAGVLLAVSAIPFLKLDWFASFLANISLLDFFGSFFSKARTVFVISFFIGVIIFVFGLLMKFFNFGIKISGYFDKFGKKKKIKNQKIEKQK